MVSKEDIEIIIKEYAGGINNPQFRAEYLCELITDLETMVIPEFDKSLESRIVIETPKPSRFDPYVSMDIGFKDYTALLFGYYDFINARLVIDDEFMINGPTLTTNKLAEMINQNEKLVFGNQRVFRRIADNNNQILLNDLYNLHGILFEATAKDNREAQINQLRMNLFSGKIIINPRCKNLIYHIKNAKWNKQRDNFCDIKASPDGTLKGGHADLLAALIYLSRNIIWSRNPILDGSYDGNMWKPNNSYEDSPAKDFMLRLIGRRRK